MCRRFCTWAPGVKMEWNHLVEKRVTHVSVYELLSLQWLLELLWVWRNILPMNFFDATLFCHELDDAVAVKHDDKKKKEKTNTVRAKIFNAC